MAIFYKYILSLEFQRTSQTRTFLKHQSICTCAPISPMFLSTKHAVTVFTANKHFTKAMASPTLHHSLCYTCSSHVLNTTITEIQKPSTFKPWGASSVCEFNAATIPPMCQTLTVIPEKGLGYYGCQVVVS